MNYLKSITLLFLLVLNGMISAVLINFNNEGGESAVLFYTLRIGKGQPVRLPNAAIEQVTVDKNQLESLYVSPTSDLNIKQDLLDIVNKRKEEQFEIILSPQLIKGKERQEAFVITVRPLEQAAQAAAKAEKPASIVPQSPVPHVQPIFDDIPLINKPGFTFYILGWKEFMNAIKSNTPARLMPITEQLARLNKNDFTKKELIQIATSYDLAQSLFYLQALQRTLAAGKGQAYLTLFPSLKGITASNSLVDISAMLLNVPTDADVQAVVEPSYTELKRKWQKQVQDPAKKTNAEAALAMLKYAYIVFKEYHNPGTSRKDMSQLWEETKQAIQKFPEPQGGAKPLW